MGRSNFIKENLLFFVGLLAMGVLAITMVFHVQFKKLDKYENYMNQNKSSIVKCQSCDREYDIESDKYCSNCGIKLEN